MREFKYKPPRVHSGELRTPVAFYKFVPKEGPEPGQQEKETIYQCWAKIDEVWMRDLEQAKANGTLSDITIVIRDPHEDFTPSNKHFISIDARGYEGQRYNVKSVQPNLQDPRFMNVIAEVVS
ncbi:head-tail adaptor protein [Halobacillus sp. BBL2006]|uniref:phage head completion protein n=1 Tax=Halobacillus sp. BBL2006 TaxID=1543706 RepID=UPI00054357EC|nr:head-tail adaptor protein [Halobacillus sp. BBL2006]KHE73157.1 phage head-tail adapter protein [Halobacillus sp. BBL2006]